MCSRSKHRECESVVVLRLSWYNDYGRQNSWKFFTSCDRDWPMRINFGKHCHVIDKIWPTFLREFWRPLFVFPSSIGSILRICESFYWVSIKICVHKIGSPNWSDKRNLTGYLINSSQWKPFWKVASKIKKKHQIQQYIHYLVWILTILVTLN